MQILGGGGVSEKLDTPVLGAATSISGGFTFAITNYSASNGYTVSTTAGSASQTSGTVTQSGLGYSTSATVSVFATRTGFITSDTATRAGTSSGAPCTPGCTPPCGTATFIGATACVGSLVAGSCGSAGCPYGCVYWNLDTYQYSQQSCVDGCGTTIYATCGDALGRFSVDSTVAATCCNGSFD